MDNVAVRLIALAASAVVRRLYGGRQRAGSAAGRVN
jgi:hypothetical protein